MVNEGHMTMRDASDSVLLVLETYENFATLPSKLWFCC